MNKNTKSYTMGRVNLAGKMSFQNVRMVVGPLNPMELKGAPVYAPKMVSNPQKSPVDARKALLEMEKTISQLKVAKRWKVDGKAYRRELRRVNKNFTARIKRVK